jgi:hypothetical protein
MNSQSVKRMVKKEEEEAILGMLMLLVVLYIEWERQTFVLLVMMKGWGGVVTLLNRTHTPL